ncbi:tyrosine-protein phosphatase [bacterium]|nr:tyrosine-protein phosphatase [bacterium]
MKLCLSKPNIDFAKFQHRVSPELVRGRAVCCPYRLYKMKKAGITQIIDLRNSARVTNRIEKFFCKLFGIKYHNFKYPHRLNGIPNHDFFESINKTIAENDGQTYIHCTHGKKRTGVCVALFEFLRLHKSRQDIVSELFERGFTEIMTKKSLKRQKNAQSILDDLNRRYFCKSEKPC